MNPLKTVWLVFKSIGLSGLIITIALNLVALHIFARPSAVFFSTPWWSVWFPNYTVWFVFAIIGFGTGIRRSKLN
jgi:hypothetical protein